MNHTDGDVCYQPDDFDLCSRLSHVGCCGNLRLPFRMRSPIIVFEQKRRQTLLRRGAGIIMRAGIK